MTSRRGKKVSLAAKPRFDPYLLSIIAILLLVGLTMVASTSMALADRDLDQPFYYLERQLIFTVLGLFAFVVAASLPLEQLKRWGPLGLLGALALLLLVLVPDVGTRVNGSLRWIRIGSFNLQVSELARLFMLIFLASYLAQNHQALRERIGRFFLPIVFVGLVCALLMAEPDFGATSVMMAITFGMLFISGAKIRHLLLLVFPVAALLAVLIAIEPYRVDRIIGFLDPWADPFDKGFHLTQALIAVGRGDWFGVGLGASVQKLFYLPHAHTDFLFAVLTEELGLVGAAFVISLYAFLVLRIFTIARKAQLAGDQFSSLLAYGVAIWLGGQAFFNIGVNLGVLPTKGLTLPLLSYGGSSLIVCLAALGLVMAVHRQTTLPRRRKS